MVFSAIEFSLYSMLKDFVLLSRSWFAS